jgi:hypothetical protein
MDWLTTRECQAASSSAEARLLAPELHAGCQQGGPIGGQQHNVCTEAGGSCVVLHDGFYRLSALAVVAGAAMLLWLQRVLPRLERLPLSAWRSRRPAMD